MAGFLARDMHRGQAPCSKGPRLVSCPVTTILKVLIIFEQGTHVIILHQAPKLCSCFLPTPTGRKHKTWTGLLLCLQPGSYVRNTLSLNARCHLIN